MKTVVSVQEISELEIKPRAEVAHWRGLVESGIAQLWKDRSNWIEIACAGCGSKESRDAFERLTIRYVECAQCGTLYAPRRPNEAALASWYRDSEAVRFWRERLLPASIAARQEKIVTPRADWILDGMAEYVPSAKRLVDISTHGRPLLDAVTEGATGLSAIFAAGMTADLESSTQTRVSVRRSAVKELATLAAADVVLAVDVIDRAAEPRTVVQALHELLAPDGVVFATFPVASGFEVQALWQDSPTVFPPDKLTLPTVEGLMRMFPAPDWEILELSTPGMFDVETVRQAMTARQSKQWPRVLCALVERADVGARAAFVEFLQAHRLTSFARLVARRVR